VLADFIKQKITSLDERINHYLVTSPMFPKLLNRGDQLLKSTNKKLMEKRKQAQATVRKEQYLRGKEAPREGSIVDNIRNRIMRKFSLDVSENPATQRNVYQEVNPSTQIPSKVYDYPISGSQGATINPQFYKQPGMTNEDNWQGNPLKQQQYVGPPMDSSYVSTSPVPYTKPSYVFPIKSDLVSARLPQVPTTIPENEMSGKPIRSSEQAIKQVV